MANIRDADVIFCVLSYASAYYEDGEIKTAKSPLSNANIYFELGHAFAFYEDKPIYIFRDALRKEEDKIPFDIRAFRIINYNNNEDLEAILTNQLVAELKGLHYYYS